MQFDCKLICLVALAAGFMLGGCVNLDKEAALKLDALIEWELNENDRKPQQNSALIALYLDTKGGLDTTVIPDYRNGGRDTTMLAEYRCYLPYGGYTGGPMIPLGVPWIKWERVGPERFRKLIVIDPGPPYKNVEKTVTLIPGEVTNLGRIVLEKVKAKGTASIEGTVKDKNGTPLEGVTITSCKPEVMTGADGAYRIDGLGLEVCDLTANKEGYIPTRQRVSVRNMDRRMIEQDLVLSPNMKIRMRYVISPLEQDDFHDPQAAEGTVELLVDQNHIRLEIETLKDKELAGFADKVGLNFQITGDELRLRQYYAPIFYKRYRDSAEGFGTIKSVGDLDQNSQRCPPIHEGDIILINGGKISPYTVKILFEQVQEIEP